MLSGVRLCGVCVQDIGEPSLQSWTWLYIQLTDGDDLNPTFDHDLYELALPEHVSAGSGHLANKKRKKYMA